jgi:pimeloyl-ACP methyl ester carboxylesterase
LTDPAQVQPVASAVATRGGRDIAYRLYGSGRSRLVLIAGTGMSGHFWDAFQVPAFSTAKTCLVVDNAGTGGTSPFRPGAWSTVEMARDVFAAMDDAGWDDAHVMGHSLGSVITQEMAHQAPGRVLSLSLHSTWASTARSGYLTAWFAARRATAVQGNKELWAAYGMLLVAPEYLDDPGLGRGPVAEAIARVGDMAKDSMLGQYDADLSHDATSYLASIDAPTLVTVGIRDLITMPELGEDVASRIAGARFETIANAGHMACLENADEFNKLQLDFLRDVEARAGDTHISQDK